MNLWSASNRDLDWGRWLAASPLRGKAMLLGAHVAVAAPTLLRAVIDRGQGDGLCAYYPFVMLAAITMDWRAATAVAIASGFLGNLLFEGTRYQVFETRCEITNAIFFGLASALMIVLAEAFRKAIADPFWLNGPGKSSKGIVFSLKDGQACASWYGGKSFVPLGPADEVERMMRDFLAQQEVAKRLNR
jgi:hypothetical protein